jgi:hypothetical protein
VTGETLADRIKRGAIPIEEVQPIAKQVAEALEEAHEKGIFSGVSWIMTAMSSMVRCEHITQDHCRQ